jgi:tetratricopeptide (TPR) repeat protein
MKALSLIALAALVPGHPHGAETFVERVPGTDPVRVNVRGTQCSATALVREIAKQCNLQLKELPADFAGDVARVNLRAAVAIEAIESIAGALGFNAVGEKGTVSILRLPDVDNPESRPALRELAMEQYQQFLAMGLHPNADAPTAWRELAALHEENYEIADAIETLKAFHESVTDPEWIALIQTEIGRLELEQGNVEEAISILSEVLDKNVTRKAAPEAIAWLGRARLKAGQPEMANRYFKIAMEKHPVAEATTLSKIWNIDAMRQLGQVEAAWTAVEQLEMQPLKLEFAMELLKARTSLAEACGAYADALEGWTTIAGFAPTAERRRECLEHAVEVARKTGDLLAELLIRVSLAPANGKDEIVGRWLVDHGMPDLAVKRLSFDPEARLRAVHDFVWHGELERARELLRATPSEGGWALVGRLIEAEIALQTKNPERVPPLIAELIRQSNDKVLVNSAFRCLGDAYLQMNDLDRAELAFRGIVPEVLR